MHLLKAEEVYKREELGSTGKLRPFEMPPAGRHWEPAILGSAPWRFEPPAPTTGTQPALDRSL